jgi:hypothetical protein
MNTLKSEDGRIRPHTLGPWKLEQAKAICDFDSVKESKKVERINNVKKSPWRTKYKCRAIGKWTIESLPTIASQVRLLCTGNNRQRLSSRHKLVRIDG